MDSHPRTSSCATFLLRARLTASHAWQRLSSLLPSGQRHPYRHTHISFAEEAAKLKPIDISLANAASGSLYLTGMSSSRAACLRPTCLLRHRYHIHRTPRRPSIAYHIAFPRSDLTFQILPRPTMQGRHSELVSKEGVRRRLGRQRATAKKGLPVRHFVPRRP